MLSIIRDTCSFLINNSSVIAESSERLQPVFLVCWKLPEGRFGISNNQSITYTISQLIRRPFGRPLGWYLKGHLKMYILIVILIRYQIWKWFWETLSEMSITESYIHCKKILRYDAHWAIDSFAWRSPWKVPLAPIQLLPNYAWMPNGILVVHCALCKTQGKVSSEDSWWFHPPANV